MHLTVLGIDLGKDSCSVVGLDETGRVVLRRRMRRDGVVRFAERLSVWQRGWDWCRAKQRPAGSPDCSGSASEGTPISERC